MWLSRRSVRRKTRSGVRNPPPTAKCGRRLEWKGGWGPAHRPLAGGGASRRAQRASNRRDSVRGEWALFLQEISPLASGFAYGYAGTSRSVEMTGWVVVVMTRAWVKPARAPTARSERGVTGRQELALGGPEPRGRVAAGPTRGGRALARRRDRDRTLADRRWAKKEISAGGRR